MALITLPNPNEGIATEAGKKIMAVSESIFQNSPTSEWAKFVVDPHDWLFKLGYRYTAKDGTQIEEGRIPKSLELVPVYDTKTRMHVRIPWHETLRDGMGQTIPVPLHYDGKFLPHLAKYFMRSCR
jgi:hypothetical protein